MRGQDVEADLIKFIGKFKHDPLGFVQAAFPWGEPGTSLERMIGPTGWQAEGLIDIGNALRGRGKGRFATASGKGIGKSCLVAWQCLHGLSTFPETRVRLTAGTDTQLRTTTMPEVAKWYNMMICKHWFRMTATSIYSADQETEKTWRMDAIPWNKDNPEAFAGLHNFGKRIVFVMDEASQIADPIYDTTDGIMSDADTEVIWSLYGNPTRSIGRFREAFDDEYGRWKTKNIDSRTVPVTDKAELAKLIQANGGEDSDYVRVHVRGMFPRVSSMQFIPNDLVKQARRNEAVAHLTDPLIMGVDVARFGPDKSVIAFRKGRDARSIPWKIMSGADVVEVSNAVYAAWQMFRPDAIHIDEGGVGGGVVDTLRHRNVPVTPVKFGGKADGTHKAVDGAQYADKRTEMYGALKAALPDLAIPDEAQLDKELTTLLYGYVNDHAIKLVSKEVMKRQHQVDSPDWADALALTYAYPVAPPQNGRMGGGVPGHTNLSTYKAVTDYNPFATV